MSLTVSKLAEAAGVSADTVRFYEREGLLPPARRSHAGYRLYEPETIERLHFIRGAQRTGLRLREIRELLDIRAQGTCPCGHTETLLARRLDEVAAEMARLVALREQLVEMSELMPATRVETNDRWPCEDHFIERGGVVDGSDSVPLPSLPVLPTVSA